MLGKLGLIMNVHSSTFEMCLRNFHQIALLRHLPQSSQYDPSCRNGNVQRQLEGALTRLTASGESRDHEVWRAHVPTRSSFPSSSSIYTLASSQLVSYQPLLAYPTLCRKEL